MCMGARCGAHRGHSHTQGARCGVHRGLSQVQGARCGAHRGHSHVQGARCGAHRGHSHLQGARCGVHRGRCLVAGGTHNEDEDGDEHEDGGAQTVEHHVLPVLFEPVTQSVDALVALAEPVKRGKSFFFFQHIISCVLSVASGKAERLRMLSLSQISGKGTVFLACTQ